MLKLEDFKIKEIDTLETISGGNGPSMWETRTVVNFMGFIVTTGSKADSCGSCDTYNQ